MKQSEVFMRSEGDAWFRRNHQALQSRVLPQDDPLLSALVTLPELQPGSAPLRILEVGCGEGVRLGWLQGNRGAKCSGIEPSADAVSLACKLGVDVQQGTAETLPFEDGSFDMVLFGFCLYLCDRDDLFRIACEADRVLRAPGWLGILDFYSAEPRSRSYAHKAGMFSHKMDYRRLFDWNPQFTCMSHQLMHHIDNSVTDLEDEWIAVSLLRKLRKELVP